MYNSIVNATDFNVNTASSSNCKLFINAFLFLVREKKSLPFQNFQKIRYLAKKCVSIRIEMLLCAAEHFSEGTSLSDQFPDELTGLIQDTGGHIRLVKLLTSRCQHRQVTHPGKYHTFWNHIFPIILHKSHLQSNHDKAARMQDPRGKTSAISVSFEGVYPVRPVHW